MVRWLFVVVLAGVNVVSSSDLRLDRFPSHVALEARSAEFAAPYPSIFRLTRSLF